MKDTIEIFSTLGQRLLHFGEDVRSRHAIDEACRDNGWFSPEEIVRSARAIARQMLDADKLREWLQAYPLPVATPRRILVVMAGNIPFVGFFDLLCVLAAGDRCRVKPSSKDRALILYIMEALKDIEPECDVALYDTNETPDAVIATGSDDARRYFAAHFAGIPSLLRGSRQSVAVLSGRETEEELHGLEQDIWTYSGLGCRNVSLLFLPHGYTPHLTLPQMNRKFKNNYLNTRALLRMTGREFIDLGQAVAVEQEGFSPALSIIAYHRYDSLQEVEEWLREHDNEIQCVVTTSLAHSRRVDFGQAQSPRLTDYADDVDVMEFLLAL